MVEPNTTTVANPNTEVPHTQGSHALSMKANTSEVESKQVQVNSEVPHIEVSEDLAMTPNTTVVEPNGEQVSEAGKDCQFEDSHFSNWLFVLLYSQFL